MIKMLLKIKEKKENDVVIKEIRYYFVLNWVLLGFLFFIITLDLISTVWFLRFPILKEGNVFMAPILDSGNWFLITFSVYFTSLVPFIIINYVAWRLIIPIILMFLTIGIFFVSFFRIGVVINNLFTVILYV